MATSIETLRSEIGELKAAQAAQAQRQAEALGKLQATIDSLNEKNDNPDLADALADLQSVTDALNAELPADMTPAPPAGSDTGTEDATGATGGTDTGTGDTTGATPTDTTGTSADNGTATPTA